MKLEVRAKINSKKLAEQFDSLLDDKCMYQIHDLFFKMCDPYVPMDEGVLAHGNVEVTKEHVKYMQPYAHYMYMGELYLAENGSSWAKKDEKKYPSGKPLHYSTEKHSLATKEWDKAMMRDKGDVFLKQVKDILLQRCKELYG